jgi:hypothetical protein
MRGPDVALRHDLVLRYRSSWFLTGAVAWAIARGWLYWSFQKP